MYVDRAFVVSRESSHFETTPPSAQLDQILKPRSMGGVLEGVVWSSRKIQGPRRGWGSQSGVTTNVTTFEAHNGVGKNGNFKVYATSDSRGVGPASVQRKMLAL